MSIDPKRRLQKGDRDLIAQSLTSQGFEIRLGTERVEAWDEVTGRYICGFYWRSAVKAKDDVPAQPGGWRFDLALADCFAVKDLKNSISEARRVQKLVPKCRAAWKEFTSSRSNGRWEHYRSLVAALFLRQDED